MGSSLSLSLSLISKYAFLPGKINGQQNMCIITCKHFFLLINSRLRYTHIYFKFIFKLIIITIMLREIFLLYAANAVKEPKVCACTDDINRRALIREIKGHTGAV